MRITSARIVSQVFFVVLFFFLVVFTSQQGIEVTEEGGLYGYPVRLFLEIDPLAAVGSALSTGSLFRGMLWALVIVIPTFFIGRFFCGWICPFGSLHHFIGWLGRRRQGNRSRREANAYRSAFHIKYLILAFFLVAAAFTTLQIGLLDPLVFLYRSITTAVLPVLNWAGFHLYVMQAEFRMAWLIGFLFILFLLLNLIIPRFFCRVLCPLGALLGVLSRFSLWRIQNDRKKCTDCKRCPEHCEGACDPQGPLRQSECIVCFNCLDDCPADSLSFRFLPPREGARPWPEVPSRRATLAALGGALFFPLARLSGRVRRGFDPAVIRPPGSLEEEKFLERCLKCGECTRVCPTNVIQPAAFEAGIEGLWTPVLNGKMGHCLVDCVLCSHVCPTGAIMPLIVDQRLGRGHYKGKPVRMGTAFVDRGRCFPWAMQTPCLVCEEVCPVSPKAVWTEKVESYDREGKPIVLAQPRVDPALCIGCAKCMYQCPVKDIPAIRVTAIGETRSRERSLVLPGS